MKINLLILFIGLQLQSIAQVKVTEFQNLDIPSEEQFGTSVAISNEYLSVGAFYGNNEQGTAYIYKFENEDWVLSQNLSSKDPQDLDWYGVSTSLNENYLLVGAPTDHWKVDRVGNVHIYELINDEWTESQVLTEGTEFMNSAYGITLDHTNDVLIVGAPAFDDSKGGAVIYENNNGEWEKAKIVYAPDDADESQGFGGAVSVYEDWVAVCGYTGVWNSNNHQYFVDLYQKLNGEWVFKQQIDLPFENKNVFTPFNNIDLSENGLFIGGHMGTLSHSDETVGGIYEYTYIGNEWVLKNDFSAAGYEQKELGFGAAQSNDFMITGTLKSASSNENLKHRALIYDNRGDNAEQVFEYIFPTESHEYMKFSMSNNWGAACYAHNLNVHGSVFIFDLRKLITDVEEETISEINIFPNPVTEFLNIESEKAQEISIINALGELVISKRKLSVGNNKIDVSDLNDGMYFIKIIGNEVPTTLEFLKM